MLSRRILPRQEPQLIKGTIKVEEGLMVLEQELASTVMTDIILLWTAHLKEEKNTMATWFPKSRSEERRVGKEC